MYVYESNTCYGGFANEPAVNWGLLLSSHQPRQRKAPSITPFILLPWLFLVSATMQQDSKLKKVQKPLNVIRKHNTLFPTSILVQYQYYFTKPLTEVADASGAALLKTLG